MSPTDELVLRIADAIARARLAIDADHRAQAHIAVAMTHVRALAVEMCGSSAGPRSISEILDDESRRN